MSAVHALATTRSGLHRAAKTERLEVRATAEQKELLLQAAGLQGQSLSEFVVRSAQEAARRALRKQNVLELSARDSRAFVEALLNPQPAGPQLRQAAARYKAFVSGQ